MAIKRNTVLKPIVFVTALSPLLQFAWTYQTEGLGANPIEVITHTTGLWTLIMLLVTLAITPLRRITGVNWLIQYRRMLGLFAFFYGVLHFLTYIWLDQFFDVQSIAKDVYKRPFITIGFAAFLAMIPLAVTSTQGWIRRLGKQWQLLHRLIYFSAAAGVVHFIWLVKKDIREPLIYAFILAVLLGWRIGNWALKGRRARVAEPRAIPAD